MLTHFGISIFLQLFHSALADFYADAGEGFAGEMGFLRLDESDYAILCCVDGEIA